MTVNELFATVAPLPFNAGDWFAEENKQHLDRLIAERHVGDAIEVGSWLGLSSRFIAERVKGTLYCIDPLERRPFCAAHLDKQGVTDFFRQFLSNCIHAKLTRKIVPIRMLSHEAAECFRFHADLIYVDGMHDEFNVARDIKAWVPHLNGGGVICGDDFCHDFPGVMTAVRKAAVDYGCPVNHEGRFWWLTPKSE